MAQVLSFRPLDAAELPAAPPTRPFLGDVLVRSGRLARPVLDAALAAQRGQDSLLGTILVVGGQLSPEALAEALSEQSGLGRVDLDAAPPDPALLEAVDPYVCLRLDAVPWRRIGGRVVIAVANPADGPQAIALLGGDEPGTALALAAPQAIRNAVSRAFGRQMARDARERCPEVFSCRNLVGQSPSWRKAAALLLLAAAIVAAPWQALTVVLAWVLAIGVATNGLRLAAIATRLRRGARKPPEVPRLVDYRRLPKVSVLVPLWREERIAEQLLAALGAMEYPPPLLDIKLVLEEADDTTRAAIARCTLPPTIEVLTVPADTLRTKPRAMNYALPFCRGDIVGVYDAEDRPHPGQLRAVVQHLLDAAPDVACVQGYLDFYNDRANLIARWFTIEYAVWFRVFLQGIERLGLPIPLGGTTVFFRRRALEALGGWDAHNVTEDADLGMRLARRGYRCEMIASTTLEEANCAGPLRWIGQRSRWQKGYAITWASHMRNPAALVRDLGWPGFLGFQVLFLGGLTSALAVPLFWVLMADTLGFGLLAPHVPAPLAIGLIVSGCVGSVTMLAAAAIALNDTGRFGMLPWALLLPLYWPLAAAAAVRALVGVFTAPFHWTKTEHGLHLGAATEEGQSG